MPGTYPPMNSLHFSRYLKRKVALLWNDNKYNQKTTFSQKIIAQWKRFFNINEDNNKFRLTALFLAAVLGMIAIALWLSLLGAVFGFKAFNPVFGSIFSHAYGILAFCIPVYLIYAAITLADHRWRPERIYVLCVSPIPFLTLAAGFMIFRNFESLSEDNTFLAFTGKTGFGILVIFFTFFELTGLRLLKKILFRNVTGKTRRWMRKRGPALLPPPKANLNNIYAEAAATGEWIDGGGFYAKDTVQDELDLPEIRPLNTPLALEYLDESMRQREKSRSTASGSHVSAHADSSVERALEEAEIIAAIHSEQQARKKSASRHQAFGKKKYHVPLDILNQYPDGEYWVIDQATRDAAITLKATLEEFKIQAEVTGIRKGPVITMFEILPAPGVKLSRIVNLQDNIALRLAAASVRIVAPIPGKHAVGIEVPNERRSIVSFREIIEGELQREGKRPEIPVVIGKDISGEALTIDLTQTPHLLIAGATGSGKSVCVNSLILSILYQIPPSECRLIFIDPKIVELKLYNDIPHLLTPVITEPKRAFQALQYCIFEMERRYACLDKMGARDIRTYNKRIKEKNSAQEHMPYIVIIVDEFADLMATTGKDLESIVARLASMSRAVGIHLVLATQRPSIDVITGLIKANIPSRIAFMVASMMDSRIIIDKPGAEKLLGKGDMLFYGVANPFPVRMQGAFISEEEVEAVVDYVKTLGEPDYIDDEIFYDDDDENISPSLFSEDDPLYNKALEIVLQQGKASASYIQRRLKIGYNRAARLVEEMEHKGVVGPAQGSKPREVILGKR